MKWFSEYVERVKPFHRASITASLHTEHVNTKEKMQESPDKLIQAQEHDVQVTTNQPKLWFQNGLKEIGKTLYSSMSKESHVHPSPNSIRCAQGWLMDTLGINSKNFTTACPKEHTQKANVNGKKGPRLHSKFHRNRKTDASVPLAHAGRIRRSQR